MHDNISSFPWVEYPAAGWLAVLLVSVPVSYSCSDSLQRSSCLEREDCPRSIHTSSFLLSILEIQKLRLFCICAALSDPSNYGEPAKVSKSRILMGPDRICVCRRSRADKAHDAGIVSLYFQPPSETGQLVLSLTDRSVLGGYGIL